MQKRSKGHFEGERALFKQKDLLVEECLFDNGESPLKEGENLTCLHSSFAWKYPLWYGKNLKIEDCSFSLDARAGIWYSQDVTLSSCRYEAPKGFRKCQRIQILDSVFPHALETLWWNENVELKNIEARQGDYFGMGSKNVRIENLSLQGNYAFDHAENLEISHSHLLTKDAFWNCKNVTIYDSSIEGEYFGWNSSNITLVRCKIKSLQGFCYIDGLKMVDCEVEADRAFEYCSHLDVEIRSRIQSIKNPLSGRIHCKGCDEIIQDDPSLDSKKVEIILDE